MLKLLKSLLSKPAKPTAEQNFQAGLDLTQQMVNVVLEATDRHGRSVKDWDMLAVLKFVDRVEKLGKGE